MHPYLPHLLADIAAACREEIPEQEHGPDAIEEELEEMEKWVFPATDSTNETVEYFTDDELQRLSTVKLDTDLNDN